MATAPRKPLPNPPAATTFDSMTRDEFREELRPVLSRLDVMEARIAALPDRGTVWQAALTSVGLVWGVTIGSLGTAVALAKAFGLF